MKEIDTVREALELALEYVGTEGGMMTRQEAKLQIALKQALAALSTIEADAKPQEPSEDAIKFLQKLIDRTYHSGNAGIQDAAALITARDDAIRRGAVSKAIEYIDSNHNDGLQWDRHDFDALRAAILATEPAREGS